MKTRIRFGFVAPILLGLLMAHSSAAPRDVQFTTVDFENSVITLENVGTETESLNGWRFCSHDDNQVRRYSSGTALNGISLQPDDVLHFHFLNDAPAGDPERINISDVGSFATPLDRGPYGIQIYFRSPFGQGSAIADHLQWSIDGIDDTSADDRSDEAESGGVWTDQSLWISTAADTTRVELDDLDGAVLHGPDDYTAIGPVIEPMPFEVDSISKDVAGVTLDWTVEKGVEYEVQRGIDLENFTPIGTTTEGTFTDDEPPAVRAFYRVVGRFPR